MLSAGLCTDMQPIRRSLAHAISRRPGLTSMHMAATAAVDWGACPDTMPCQPCGSSAGRRQARHFASRRSMQGRANRHFSSSSSSNSPRPTSRTHLQHRQLLAAELHAVAVHEQQGALVVLVNRLQR